MFFSKVLFFYRDERRENVLVTRERSRVILQVFDLLIGRFNAIHKIYWNKCCQENLLRIVIHIIWHHDCSYNQYSHYYYCLTLVEIQWYIGNQSKGFNQAHNNSKDISSQHYIPITSHHIIGNRSVDTQLTLILLIFQDLLCRIIHSNISI